MKAAGRFSVGFPAMQLDDALDASGSASSVGWMRSRMRSRMDPSSSWIVCLRLRRPARTCHKSSVLHDRPNERDDDLDRKGWWLLGEPDETRDRFIVAALGEPGAAWEAWRALVSRGAHLRHDPITRRWLALVGLNLRGRGEDSALDVCDRASRENWAHALHLVTIAGPVCAGLREHGIRCVVLKGAALGATVYPHLGVRPFGDVDILIPPTSFAPACEIIEALGWKSPRAVGSLARDLSHAIDFSRPTGGSIDLHRQLLTEGGPPDVDLGVWQRVEPATVGRIETLVLGPADTLLHVIVHGIRRMPVHPGTWLADATYLLRTTGHRVAWDVLVDEARRRRLSYQVRQGLELVRDVGRVDIPARVISELSRTTTAFEPLECRVKVRGDAAAKTLSRIVHAWRRSGLQPDGSRRGLLASFVGLVRLDSPRYLGRWVVAQVGDRVRSVRERRRRTSGSSSTIGE